MKIKKYSAIYTIFFLLMTCAFVLSSSYKASATEEGYTAQLLPLTVEPSTEDGKTWISGTFKLFNDGSASKDLDASNIIAFEDEVEQSEFLEIIPPDGSSGTRMADFVFVIDVTGSMGGEISAVKNNIQNFATKLSGSEIDYRLSMVTFRDDVIVEGDTVHNPSKGAWTADADQFKSWINATTLGWGADGPEASFDAVGKAADFTTREGAQRIVILFTDASAHVKGDTGGYYDPTDSTFSYTQSGLIEKLTANGFVCYVAGPSNSQFKGSGSISEKTGGRWYSIRSDIGSILDDIHEDIKNQYAFKYLSSAAAGEHYVEIGFTLSGYESYQSNEQTFSIAAAPVVTLSDETMNIVETGWHTEGEDIEISVRATDEAEPLIQEVTLYYRHAESDSGFAAVEVEGYTSLAMTEYGEGVYKANIPGSVVSDPAVEFFVIATDGVRNGTSPKTNASVEPWRISIVNHPPVISSGCPTETYNVEEQVTVQASVTDEDGDSITSVTLYYKVYGSLSDYTTLEMSGTGGDYSANIPAEYATASGIEFYIVAKDDRGGESAPLTCTIEPERIPVQIKSVTKLLDTSDTSGPYSIRAIVLSADTVSLHYKVAGEEQVVDMTASVTETAAREDRSNIYYVDMSGQSAGSVVEYWVTATNATLESSDEYPVPHYSFTVRPAPEEMAITPESIVLAAGETAEFIATGCYGSPYNWTTDAGTLSTTTGEKATLTAGNIPGLYSVRAADPGGVCAATAIVEIIEPLYITPDAINLKASASIEFTAAGGEYPYTWSLSDGPATLEGSTVTASDTESGSVVLTVQDSAGRTATANIKINGPLSLTPGGKVELAIGGSQEFTVSGGKSPYSWEVVGGNLDVYEGDTVTYQAPTFAGTYTVQVTDADGETDSALIVVGTPMQVTPMRRSISNSETASFTVIGGTSPYTWTATEGDVSPISGDNVTFTPPYKDGIYELTVTDSAGSILSVKVEVISGLSVTPQSIEIGVNETKVIKVISGSGSYTWTAITGDVAPTSGDVVTYTAPASEGTDTVTVTDSVTGQQVEISITIVVKADLTISPSTATVSPKDTYTFSVQGNKGDVKWTTNAGEITQEGIYTAPASSGTYTVTVIDLNNGRKAEATVNVLSQLIVTPTEATINTNSSEDFTVSGGEAPYTWRVIGEGDLSSTSGETVTFTSGSKSGTSTIVVIDNTGTSGEVEVTVSGTMLMTPASVTLAPGNTQQFSVSGGTGTITWTADKGDIDDTGMYTAPSDIGTYTITATDSSGNEASALVTVGNIPVITPAQAWLEKGGNTDFTVVGGTGPYGWTATAGTISGSGNTITYTAPGVSNEVTVTVTDSLGQKSEAIIYVDLPLQATREEIYVKPGQTAKVAVTGGIPPFEWQTTYGEMDLITTENAGINVYTAPNVMKDDTITIRDRGGNTTTVTVHVTKPLSVTPNVRYMERGEIKTFTVVSGVPPYTAAVIDGDGDIDPAISAEDEDVAVFTFTAGTTADDDVIIEFSDNSGQTVEVHAFVETTLKVSPSIIYVDKSATASFRVTGGTGGYVVVAESGFADVDTDTGKGTYEAPNRYGKYKITVSDSSDKSISIIAQVEKSTPVISPSQVTMSPGETRKFMVNMGVAPYEWAFEGELWQSVSTDNSVIEITAPQVAGSYKLSLQDNAGNEAEATVDVTQPLMVTPISYTIYKGEDPTVRVEAIGGIGSYEWILGDLDKVKEGDNFIVVKPRTDLELGTEHIVICRDQEGSAISMSIVLSIIPGDQNGDGKIDDNEMQTILSSYFQDTTLDGVTLDDSTVAKQAEIYLDSKE